jgi:uracil-DNA glycosylase
MNMELDILKPQLVIPIGKLAISQFIECDKLDSIIGRKFVVRRGDHVFDFVPLPHPSGASPWHRVSPGRELLAKAMNVIASLPAMKRIMKSTRTRKPL